MIHNNDRLNNKEYNRPKANSAFGSDRDGRVYGHPDWILLPKFETFVVQKNKDANVPEPGKSWFGVGSTKMSGVIILRAGDRVMVELHNGKLQVRQIRKIEGRVLLLETPLDASPKLGGKVYKVIGQSTAFIDSKYSEGNK